MWKGQGQAVGLELCFDTVESGGVAAHNVRKFLESVGAATLKALLPNVFRRV